MNRRSLLLGLGAALAAPAIVKAENLMKIAAVRQDILIERVEVDLFFAPPVVALNEHNLEKALIAMRNCLRVFRDNNPLPDYDNYLQI
jgi:hypothetical protein